MEIITPATRIRNLFESRFPKDKIIFNENWESYVAGDNEVEYIKFYNLPNLFYHFSNYNISMCFEKFEDLEKNFDDLINMNGPIFSLDIYFNSESNVIKLINRLGCEIKSQRVLNSTDATIFSIDDDGKRYFSFCENCISFIDELENLKIRFCDIELFEKAYLRFVKNNVLIIG